MSPVLAFALLAIPSTTIDLWPSGPPDGWTKAAVETRSRDENLKFDLVSNVSKPTLTIYPAKNAKPSAPTVVVCPGGGYSIEAIEHEGTEIVDRLNQAGINAALLKYRIPNRDTDKPLHKAPLQDSQRAIRILRSRAAKFGLDPKRVGIMGFSAGGHLAAATSTSTSATYAVVDAADSQDFKPNFTILVYPAYLDTDKKPDLPADIVVTAQTPPVFIVQAMDDRDYVMSAFAYSIACQRMRVPCDLHLYAKGGHGYGLRSKEPGLSKWMDQVIAWLDH